MGCLDNLKDRLLGNDDYYDDDDYDDYEDDEPQAVFFFQEGPDATYGRIEGAWTDEGTYHVVHRIAGREGAGAGRHCLEWAISQAQSLRIGTHEDNAPMRHVLAHLGFAHCGTIICDKGTPRVAYQHRA